MHGDAGDLDLAQHVDGLVPRHLELRQRLAEHLTGLRVVERERVGGFAHADQLGGEQHRRVVGDPPPEAARDRRAARRVGRAVWSNSKRANLRVTSSDGAGCASVPASSTRNVCSPRGYVREPAPSRPSGRPSPWASHRRACGASRGPPRARAHGRSDLRGRPRRARRCPVRVPHASAASRSSRPKARAASVATIADEKNGPGKMARPISSCTATASITPRPRPPCRSGTRRPVQPRSTILRHISGVIPASSCSAIRRTYALGASAARNARTVSRNAIWSCENVKSTPGTVLRP